MSIPDLTRDAAVVVYVALVGGLAAAMAVAIVAMLWDQRKR
jgi:hypothetical protein